MRKETAMKSGFWHWIQRFLMAEVLILGLALPLLMIRSGGAEDHIVASEIDPMVETVALDQVGSQETVEITAADVGVMAAAATAGEDFEDDPWESFNEKMFTFNREVLDRYKLNPVPPALHSIPTHPAPRGFHNY